MFLGGRREKGEFRAQVTQKIASVRPRVAALPLLRWKHAKGETPKISSFFPRGTKKKCSGSVVNHPVSLFSPLFYLLHLDAAPLTLCTVYGRIIDKTKVADHDRRQETKWWPLLLLFPPLIPFRSSSDINSWLTTSRGGSGRGHSFSFPFLSFPPLLLLALNQSDPIGLMNPSSSPRRRIFLPHTCYKSPAERWADWYSEGR